MYQPVKMKRLRILALSKYKYPLLKGLHELGVVQMIDAGRAMESSEWSQLLDSHPSDPSIRRITAQVMSFNKAIDLFETVSPVPEDDFFKMLINPSPPRKIASDKIDGPELLEKADKILEGVNSVLGGPEERLNQIASEISDLSSKMESLERIRDFRVDLSDVVETDLLTVLIGVAPKEQVNEISGKVSEVSGGVYYTGSQDVSETESAVLVVTLTEVAKEVTDSLRRLGFERVDVSGLSGIPGDALSDLSRRIASLNSEEESLSSEIAGLAGQWRDKLQAYRENLIIERDRLDVQTNFMKTAESFILEGWVPAKSVGMVKDEVLKISEGFSVVEVTDPNPVPDDIPVHLENPRFVKHFQLLTELFARPKYNEIDPTFLLAPVFMLFFGIMLTDAVYGVMMTAVGLLLLRGGGKYSDSVKDFGVMFTAIGSATIVFGILTGGYLGDFAKTYLGIKALSPILFDPMVDVQLFLGLVLIIGLIHLNLGLVLGLKANLQQKEVKEAMGSQGWLFFLQIGVVFLALGMKSLGAAFFLIAVAMVAVIHGPLFFFDITGYLGDVLSYARLLALGLATGGIAMTVNILATMVKDVPFIGIVIAAVVFFVGHTFNWGMNGLGAFVHGIRLHYVEFFDKFYEGGGSEYKPYQINRELTTE